MEPFAVIIPTRGDRPALLQRAGYLLGRQTLQPSQVFVIDYPPASDAPDLVQRIREGMRCARKAGIDFVYIWEDDDYYPPTYLEMHHQKVMRNTKAIGYAFSWYYHIGRKMYHILSHYKRSALFSTGFSISGIEKYPWPADDCLQLDFHLWDWLHHESASWNLVLHISHQAPHPIGIKHGIGKCGGVGHTTLNYDHADPDWQWLTTHTSSYDVEFYKNLLKQ